MTKKYNIAHLSLKNSTAVIIVGNRNNSNFKEIAKKILYISKFNKQLLKVHKCKKKKKMELNKIKK